MNLTEKQLEMLKEIRDCQGFICYDQYTNEERRELKKLEKLGLLNLGYHLRTAGKEAIEPLRKTC